MRIVNLSDYEAREPMSIALGAFDGIHIGHVQVIKSAVSFNDMTSAVLVFEPRPQRVFSKNQSQSIITPEFKRRILSNLGVEMSIKVNFFDISRMTPEEFVKEILVDKLNTKRVTCGFNFTFGKDGAGKAEDLLLLGYKYNFEVSVKDPVMVDGEIVSATLIRSYIESGEMEKAAQMLGRNFSYDFEVIEGDKRGRILGAPTCNQAFPDDFIRPKFGVYASRVVVDGEFKPSLTNFGIRPTIGGEVLLSETSIIDYDGSLYGKALNVELLKFIREEIKFNSLEELREQINCDMEKTKLYFNS